MIIVLGDNDEKLERKIVKICKFEDNIKASLHITYNLQWKLQDIYPKICQLNKHNGQSLAVARNVLLQFSQFIEDIAKTMKRCGVIKINVQRFGY